MKTVCLAIALMFGTAFAQSTTGSQGTTAPEPSRKKDLYKPPFQQPPHGKITSTAHSGPALHHPVSGNHGRQSGKARKTGGATTQAPTGASAQSTTATTGSQATTSNRLASALDKHKGRRKEKAVEARP